MQQNQKQIISINHIVLGKSLIIGLFGGIFLVLFFSVMYYFNMTEINVFKPWKKLYSIMKWPVTWYMYPLWMIIYGLTSILPAIGYFLIGKNRTHWGVGVLYGLGLAILVYMIIPNLLWNYHVWHMYEWKTHIGVFVFFIIYGVFIGYSISYEYSTQFYLAKKKSNSL